MDKQNAQTTAYTLIDIGPIFDTMELTSTPAGMWGASYMFSWIARELITELVFTHQIPAQDFVAPAFDAKDGRIVIDDDDCREVMAVGVGMFHDRIIFAGSCLGQTRQAIDTVTERLAQQLPGAYNQVLPWLRQYLRLYAVVRQIPVGASPIVATSILLGAMELEPAFPTQETGNPLLQLFESVAAGAGASSDSNQAMRNSQLVTELEGSWMLYRSSTNQTIRDIRSIANPRGDAHFWKTQQYYAVLNSDGDAMGKIYQTLSTPEEIRRVSRKSLQFCARAAKLILHYGGLPIYAGGDDLLAILPTVGFSAADGSEQTILELADTLNGLFNEIFQEEQAKYHAPTISIGVSVQYIKAPLYEALSCAESMLYQAKQSSPDKNALRLHLQKHSGQSVILRVDRMGLSVANVAENPTALQELNRLIAKSRSGKASREQEGLEHLLTNAGHTLEEFISLVQRSVARLQAGESAALRNLFDNLFDNADQRRFDGFLGEVCSYCECFASANSMLKADELTERLLAQLRFLRFMVEKKEAEE